MAPLYRQHLPRPAEAREAGPAAWKAVPPELRTSVPIRRVREAFADRPAIDPADSIDASVLIPIQERDGEATVVMIRRADDLANDAGHVAFPGGHVESEEDPIRAALREANEEIGLDSSLVEVISTLAPFGRRLHQERVLPVVGIVNGQPDLVPDRREVAAILEVPIASLASDAASWQENWGTDEPGFVMTFFAGLPELGDDLVWGLSARILELVLSTIFPGEQDLSE